jgi:hypothetical protein
MSPQLRLARHHNQNQNLLSMRRNSSAPLFPELQTSAAIFSADEVYRYMLSRQWDENLPIVGFICLNPSTADAEIDDQTVKKCIRFAKKWGGGKLIIGNLFAFKSTDPAALKKTTDPVGPDNDAWLDIIVAKSDILVAAWGNHGTLAGRDASVIARYLSKLSALRLSKDGHPSHPLYLPETLVPIKFNANCPLD